MRAWLENRLWMAACLLLVLGSLSCNRSSPSKPAGRSQESALLANTDTARSVPRRSTPLVFTNRTLAEGPPAAAPPTNNAPVVSCGAAQTLPCSPADGVQVILSAHVQDLDGDALSVTWNADGVNRYTQQLAAGSTSNALEVTFSYTFSPGEHAIKVAATDGTLSAVCETAVTVTKDAQAPVIACPRSISVPVDPGACGAVVTFQPRATDNCPDVTVTCEPPPGSLFPIGVTTVTCTATDASGNESDCAFDVAVEFRNRCPQGEAFWRQNPGAWPVASLKLGAQTYTRSQLLPLLRAPVPADASIALVRQLIAASLNVANGSDPRPICEELARANDLLARFSGKLPYHVAVSSGLGRSMVNLSTRLNGYNGAMLSSDCVP